MKVKASYFANKSNSEAYKYTEYSLGRNYAEALLRLTACMCVYSQKLSVLCGR